MNEQDYVSGILAEGERLNQEKAARRQKLEEELRALGLNDEEYQSYRSARFDLEFHEDQILRGSVIAFAGMERTLGLEMQQAKKTISTLEKNFPQLRDTYNRIMGVAEPKLEGSDSPNPTSG